MKLPPLIITLFGLISANPLSDHLKILDKPGRFIYPADIVKMWLGVDAPKESLGKPAAVTTTLVPTTASTTTMTPISVSATTSFETTTDYGTMIKKLTKHTFTNCGSTGANGPSYENCISEYSKNSEFDWTSNPDVFKINQEGYQEWTVQTTGTYNVVASGARGGQMGSKCNVNGKMSCPGKGATVSADFKLIEGETIYIAVGQMGTNGQAGGGGGGGTFVVKKPQGSDISRAKEEHILLIAAGGAGSPGNNDYGKGGDGQGKRHQSFKGTGGAAREFFYQDWNEEAAGGGGFHYNGAKTTNCDGGQAFTTGLKGGKGNGTKGTGSCQTGGGFGGGGGQVSDGSPGAGGWVGGKGNPGPGHSGKNKAWSYISDSATNEIRKIGSNEGHGSVVIQLIMVQICEVSENHSELESKDQEDEGNEVNKTGAYLAMQNRAWANSLGAKSHAQRREFAGRFG